MNLSKANSSMSLDCPVYTENSDYYIGQVGFWVEGVIQTAVGIPGIMGKWDITQKLMVMICFKKR